MKNNYKTILFGAALVLLALFGAKVLEKSKSVNSYSSYQAPAAPKSFPSELTPTEKTELEARFDNVANKELALNPNQTKSEAMLASAPTQMNPF